MNEAVMIDGRMVVWRGVFDAATTIPFLSLFLSEPPFLLPLHCKFVIVSE